MYKIDEDTKYYLRVYKESLARDMVVPQNGKKVGNEGPLVAYGINGAIEILALVTADITIADSKKLTITLEQSNDNTNWEKLTTLYTITATSGSGSLKKGSKLGAFGLLSDTKRYVQAQIETDDPNASGKLDILPVYLPR